MTKLLLKRGINLDKVKEKFPSFHARIIETGWDFFDPIPCDANENWVHELYAKLSVPSFANPVITIQGRQVNFGIEQINAVYGLLNANMEQFHIKEYEQGTWMANILCLGKQVPWAKKYILKSDFTSESRL